MKKRQISAVHHIDGLHEKCAKLKPNMVFLNEDCFIHEADATERIKRVISLNPDTLFFIFMAITNVHFDDYLYVRKNVIISSKSIKPQTMSQLLNHYLERKLVRPEKSSLDQTPVTLSQTESNMLRMWMSGQGTIQNLQSNANQGENRLFPQGKHQKKDQNPQQADSSTMLSA